MTNFLLRFSKKIFLMCCALTTCVNMNAADEGAYAIKYAATAYPSGAGKVYAHLTNDVAPEANSDVWKDTCYVETTSMLSQTSAYTFGLGNEGWTWTGVAVGVKNDEGVYAPQRDEEGKLVWKSVENNLIDITTHSEFFDTEDEALAGMPTEPDTLGFALFGRVAPAYARQMALLGKVSLDNPTNDMGEKVTLTATPITETSRFLYWTKNDPANGEKVTDNPLEITVTESAVYYAHFDDPAVVKFNGDEGYVIWYNDTTWAMPGYVDGKDSSVVNLCWQDSRFVDATTAESTAATSYYKSMDNGTYTLIGGYPHLLKINGPAILKNLNNIPSATLTKMYSMLRYTGEEGLDTDFVECADGTVNYFYLLNIEKMLFEKCNDFILPAKRIAVVLNSASLQTEMVPEVIYTSLEQYEVATGIEDITAEDMNKAVKNGKVYDLNGMQMIQVKKGIFILNGKKYVK